MAETNKLIIVVDKTKKDVWRAGIDVNGNKDVVGYRATAKSSKIGDARFESVRSFDNVGDVEVRIRGGQETSVSNMPEPMRKRLAIFLSENGSEDKDYDCIKFVQFVNGELSPSSRRENLEALNMPTVRDVCELEPGDIIHLARSEKFRYSTGVHGAVYLGEEVFISKLGSWRVTFQDIDQIKAHYGEASVFVQKPRK